jgi:photosystem II stability/assembly factor-like uncharacterized protein
VEALGTDGHTLFIPHGSNSYISSNDGDTWTRLDTNLTKFSNPDAILSIDSTTYLAGSWITNTTDGGLTWNVNSVSNGNNAWNIIGVSNIGKTLFVVDRVNGVFRSTDSGTTWNTSSPPFSAFSSIVCLAPVGSELFAGTNDGLVYQSTDSGTTWQISESGLSNGVEISSLAFNNNVLFAGMYSLGMFCSFDSGQTWSQCSRGLSNTSVNAIASTGDTVIAGANTGLFFSTDNGASWQSKLNGKTNYNTLSLFIDDSTLLASTQGGRNSPSLFSSTDWGETWSADTLINGYNLSALTRSGPNLIAGGYPFNYSTGFFESTNEGMEWTQPKVSTDTEIVVLGIASIEATLIAATNVGIYSSYSNGDTWSLSNEFLTQNGTSYKYQPAIQSVGIMGTQFWVGTSGSYPHYSGSIFFSDDAGVTWHPVEDTSIPPKGYVTCFASYGTTLFVATDSAGIFLTNDSGAHWTSENLGLGDTNVISLAIQGNELLAGTASSGVWRSPLAEMIPSSSVASGKQIADTISVYPDPASSIVTVSCPDLTGTTEASLISETGATVWHRTITANGQPFELDLTGVANGAYRLNFVSGGVTQTSKIVLQR